MTGQDLHRLLIEKWDYSYDVQLKKQPRKIFFPGHVALPGAGLFPHE